MIAQTHKRGDISSNLNPQRESVEELTLQVVVANPIISTYASSRYEKHTHHQSLLLHHIQQELQASRILHQSHQG